MLRAEKNKKTCPILGTTMATTEDNAVVAGFPQEATPRTQRILWPPSGGKKEVEEKKKGVKKLPNPPPHLYHSLPRRYPFHVPTHRRVIHAPQRSATRTSWPSGTHTSAAQPGPYIRSSGDKNRCQLLKSMCNLSPSPSPLYGENIN